MRPQDDSRRRPQLQQLFTLRARIGLVFALCLGISSVGLAQSILVTSPNGGESWQAGTTHNITWTSSNVTGTLKIWLVKSGQGVLTIATGVSNTGSYSWAIPSGTAAGTDYQIGIWSESNTAIVDYSNSTFTMMFSQTGVGRLRRHLLPSRGPFLLTSLVGEGVTGSPATGAAPYPKGTSVSYGYVPASGFSGATVEIEWALAPPTGALLMNTNHSLWAWGQPSTGTDFAESITVPNDASVIPYPGFYAGRPSQTVRVADPYCAVRSTVISYPHSFLGGFPLPEVRGAPLPASILRGVGLKDYWSCCLSNATLNEGCSVSLRDALMETLARVKHLGADHTSVTTWAYVVDASSSTPVLDLAHPEIPETDLSYIAGKAAAAGLDLWLYVNIPSGDQHGAALPRVPSQEWEVSFLDSYAQFIVQTAKIAQNCGVTAIMLNWRDFSIDLSPFEDVYAAKMSVALAEARKVFHGKVLLYDVFGSDLTKVQALFHGVDAIQADPWIGLTPTDNQNLTLAAVKQAYTNALQWRGHRYAAFGKPIVLNALIQSHRNFLQTGWVEDGFCVNNCEQNLLQTDFSVQAIGYEALFEAARESGLSFLSFEAYGYWFSDVILPKDSFPNLSQSPRNKPAEAIIYRWFEAP